MTFEDPKRQQNDDMQEDQNQNTGSLGGEATDEISETDFDQSTVEDSSEEDQSEEVE